MGWVSILLWMCAQMPQLAENYKNKTAQSLSFFFLIQWFSGDVCNLIGCILTDQLPTQLYTAIYFVAIDTVTVSQFVYYNNFYKGGRARRSHNAKTILSVFLMCSVFATSHLVHFSPSPFQGRGRVLLAESICGENDAPDWQNVVGTAIAWGSGVIYVASRIPQIHKNYKRKTCEGLSSLMFIAAILGNATYGISVLTRFPITAKYMVDKMPFLVGSLGTCCFDFTILLQFYKYRSPVTVRYSLMSTSSRQDLEEPDELELPDDEALRDKHPR
mmetsp:Transcript_39412/g.85369  ORF Transcript_39412/g.85369 Transcript_39412/m.85369 type:complete len:273 (-) Transcript_39412:34-852(-)